MMDKLEGQYFEKTISALKKAKAREDFVMRPEFKAELRSGLLKKIDLGLDRQAESSWVERVLQMKYLLAGVPVLAVLAIVATNFSNWQVELPNQQIVPIVNEQKNQDSKSDQTDLKDSSNANVRVEAEPTIVTFSAASVMPPADVLMKAKTRQGDQKSSLPTNSEDHDSKVTPTFVREADPVKLAKPTIQIYTYTPAPAPTLAPAKGETPVDTQPNAVIIHGQNNPSTGDVVIKTENPQLTENTINTAPAQSIPIENNGRIEDHGQIQQLINVENRPAEVVPEISDSAKDNIIIRPEVITNAEITQPPALPTFQRSARIYFQGEQDEAVVTALLDDLANGNENLENDYYINVMRIEKDRFKAVLFEDGRIKEVLVLGYREGKLTVITQIVY